MCCYYHIRPKPSLTELSNSAMLVLQAAIKYQNPISNLNAFGPQTVSFIKLVFVTQLSFFKLIQCNLLVFRKSLKLLYPKFQKSFFGDAIFLVQEYLSWYQILCRHDRFLTQYKLNRHVSSNRAVSSPICP